MLGLPYLSTSVRVPDYSGRSTSVLTREYCHMVRLLEKVTSDAHERHSLSFAILWILFGSSCELTRSRSSLHSLFNLQFGYAFLLLARNRSSKLGSSLARLLLTVVKSRWTSIIIPKSDNANLYNPPKTILTT